MSFTVPTVGWCERFSRSVSLKAFCPTRASKSDVWHWLGLEIHKIAKSINQAPYNPPYMRTSAMQRTFGLFGAKTCPLLAPDRRYPSIRTSSNE